MPSANSSVNIVNEGGTKKVTTTSSGSKEGIDVYIVNQLVPEIFDYIILTYVAAGDGVGEVETVVYKTGGSGGTTVATLTLGYDGSNRLDEVTRT